MRTYGVEALVFVERMLLGVCIGVLLKALWVTFF